jgi:FMN phosphatase YigB (HAD superfamily)
MMSNRVSENITSIIFDLGGVLFDIDYALTQRAFMDLGFKGEFNNLYSQKKQSGVFDEFEKGLISPSQFREHIKESLPEYVNEKQIDAAWNALLIGFPVSKVELLKRLSKDYRLFLLSNTNEIHLPVVMNMVAHLDGQRGIGHLFERAYYSCQMGMRKPDIEIFEKVCKENSLDVSKTLFVDDLLQNIEGAKQTGLSTLHCTVSVKLEEYFK